MITLDTSGLIAAFDTRDRDHASCVRALEQDVGPFIIPIAILGEIAWMLESMFPPGQQQLFLADVQDGAYSLDWDAHDVGRIQQLTRRYRDLALGISDAAVIACAERNGGRVLTVDRRHFPVVSRGERTLVLLPG